MWAIAKYILDKNNSPAWGRINNIINIAKKATSWQNSAKNTYTGAVTNDGMYGSYGG